jgi:general secretion pathway protein C
VLASSLRSLPSLEEAPLVPVAAGGMGGLSPKTVLSSSADRNLMGLKREELHPELAENSAPTEVTGRDFVEAELKPCTVAAVLKGTLVYDTPEWSSAVLLNNSTNETEVYTINEGRNRISDDAVLVAVRSREIVVRRRDHFEKCSAEGEEPAPYPETASYAPPSDSVMGSVGGGEGVTKVNDTQFVVERGELDRTLSNLSEVSTQARLVPSFKNGKANGFKLFSIKPGSIYSKIGMQNGDVIQRINGYEMNSPDKALEIYQKLRESTSISIEFQRRGQNISHNYSIR